MNEELTTELAGQIAKWHNEAQELANESRRCAENALDAAIYCGQHLEAANTQTKGQFLAWLRDNVPDLKPEQAKAYMTLLHVHRERESHALDHRQLLLLGVIDKADAKATDRGGASHDPSQSTKWIGWASNIRGWWTKATRERPVTNWSDEEREAVRNQLKPLIDIYNAL